MQPIPKVDPEEVHFKTVSGQPGYPDTTFRCCNVNRGSAAPKIRKSKYSYLQQANPENRPCDEPHYGHGLCRMHYMRWNRARKRRARRALEKSR